MRRDGRSNATSAQSNQPTTTPDERKRDRFLPFLQARRVQLSNWQCHIIPARTARETTYGLKYTISVALFNVTQQFQPPLWPCSRFKAVEDLPCYRRGSTTIS